VALAQQVDALRDVLDELGRREDLRVLAQAEHERRELAGVRVGRGEDDAVVDVAHLAEAAVVALDLPGDALGHPDLGGVERVAELPAGAVGVPARVEALGPLEVVLGLRRVGDLAADPVEAEDPDRVALVRAADEVELAVLEEQVVRVDLARVERVALQRVVVERDRLVAEDRRLDLGQVLRELAGARARRDVQVQAVHRVERARPAPGDLLQGEAQRLGVRELAVEQPERGVQPRELVVVEGDGGRWKFSGRSE
jgi:hypothetical protein